MQAVIRQKQTLVDGPMSAGVWNLSWPLLLNMMILAFSNFVEGWIAGRLGPDVQAAVGLGSQIWFMMMMMTLALSAGTTALVSRYWGAADWQAVQKTARQALVFALLFGVTATFLGLVCCRDVLQLFGASPSLAQKGWQYLQFTILSMTPYTVLWISNSIFRASGDSRTPMTTMLIVTILTVSLELLLCLGPIHVGVAGIGVAWIIASSVGVLLNFNLLKRSQLANCVNIRLFMQEGLSVSWMLKFLRIGLPACLQDLSLIGGSFGIFFILSHTKNALISQAAWATGWRVEEVLTIMPIYGLSMAAATLVGQNLGANKRARAKLAGWQVTIFGVISTSAIATFMYFAAPAIAHFMSDDIAVANACTEYLRTVSVSEPFFAGWLILVGAMQGAGYTRAPMVATICCFNLLRLSLAWFFSITLGFGASAVWTAMSISSLVAGLTLVWQWHKESWQSSSVFSS